MLTESSKSLVDIFNICLANYNYYINKTKDNLIDNDSKYFEILGTLKIKINTEEYTINLLEYVIEKLSAFSNLYNVDISKFDDMKINYFISLYFLEEDKEYCNLCEKKIILVVLHKIMSSTLLSYEPKIMLDKLKLFIHKNSYDTFHSEYGEIGYYHMMKSIYLMQKVSAELLIDDTKRVNDNWIIHYLKAGN